MTAGPSSPVRRPAAPARMGPAFRRPHSLGAIVLCALVLLTGCGGEDEDEVGSTADSTASAEPSETAAEPTSDPTVEAEDDTPETAGGLPTIAPNVEPDPATLADAAVPKTFDEAVRLYQRSPKPILASSFLTPSGNIYCSGLSGVSACEIADGGVADPAVCHETAPTVGRIELTGQEAVAVCNSDTIRNGEPMPLDYGQRARIDAPADGAGPVMDCLSLRSGVVCLDVASGSGFSLARGSYHLLS